MGKEMLVNGRNSLRVNKGGMHFSCDACLVQEVYSAVQDSVNRVVNC